MPFLNGLLVFLDSRSFSSVWFWLMLTVAWTLVGRSVLGVPHDVVRRAMPHPRSADPVDSPDALILLDWLSLVLPRWRIAPTEALWLVSIASFALSILFFLGFGYGFEMAQALFFLIAPLTAVALLNLYLARRLRAGLAQAQAGLVAPGRAAATAAQMMLRHRFVIAGLSVLVIAICAIWGALWMIVHPFGF